MIDAQVPASDAWPCAGAEVARLFGCGRREYLATVALVAAPAALAWVGERYGWLALFCAILLPIALASPVLLLARALLGSHFRWSAAWAVLLVALAAGAAAGLGVYQHLMAMFALPGMADARVLAASFGVGALAMGVPLWHAQGQATARQVAELRQAALVSELKTLQAQVEPHFLYNTLANARYLARRDPEKGAQMLEHLIGYLHGALPDMRADMSTLGREFQLADHYLALMAIRFGERLRYRAVCPPELAALPIPPLMLMTLVENAVKHGVEPQPGLVSVRLSASVRDDGLVVTVADDGAGPGRSAGGGGVGLANVRARLASMYGAAASFTLGRGVEGLTEARLVLPLNRVNLKT
ncbi:MAG: sensor histidine kinase [Telluria sp.]